MTQISIDPVSRYLSLTYGVPASAPDELDVRLELRRPKQGGAGAEPWRPAAVWKHASDTGLGLMDAREW